MHAYQGERLGQGRENAKVFLKENQDIMDEIHQAIRDHYQLDGEVEREEGEPEQETLDV